jgi:hypothetical protein
MTADILAEVLISGLAVGSILSILLGPPRGPGFTCMSERVQLAGGIVAVVCMIGLIALAAWTGKTF